MKCSKCGLDIRYCEHCSKEYKINKEIVCDPTMGHFCDSVCWGNNLTDGYDYEDAKVIK